MRAAELYDVQVAPLRRARALRNLIVELLMSSGSGVPSDIGRFRVLVVDRATGRTIFEDPSTDETGAALLRERLESDLNEMSADEFTRTWA